MEVLPTVRLFASRRMAALLRRWTMAAANARRSCEEAVVSRARSASSCTTATWRGGSPLISMLLLDQPGLYVGLPGDHPAPHPERRRTLPSVSVVPQRRDRQPRRG